MAYLKFSDATGKIMADEQKDEKKNKKVNRMTLSEVDAAIKKTQEHMKGMNSKYAKELVGRQAELKAKK
ncbi:MAG: hypothetical protein K1X70_19315 [Leptospirales bacterium]|jgi:hypothetical protein|nr:hypothetical protein [Leptospirales bacterium]HMU83012.1 hypothetical protein [Leptospiraceae bacterium]HMW58450.1 hypothetical protein [Leptospiraceae bacterium]HMZ36799.1 hypothetical protein [Leptospiraceae bacterium]HNE22267.1 hypothetical protein [Leptospiraceae bacterium]